MADAMQAAGVGPEIEYKGRVYKFQAVRVQEIGKFEAWLERQAWEGVYRQESWLPARKFRELCTETRLDIAAQQYRFGGDAFNKASVSSPGIKQIALISLKAGEDNAPEIDGELIESLLKDKAEEMSSALVGIGWLRKPDAAQ